MAQATTVILLPKTPYNGVREITGSAQPAAAYYLGNQDLQTLSWTTTEFNGLITVQASLVETPANSDWFTVFNLPGSELTITGFQNINGNFVRLRVKVTNFTRGVIQSIKVSY
jgi:hypothetical protein